MAGWAVFWKLVFFVSIGLFFAVAAVVAVRGFVDLIEMFSRLKDMSHDHDR
jgi:hypothetical protein